VTPSALAPSTKHAQRTYTPHLGPECQEAVLMNRRLPGSRNASFVSLNNTMSFVDDDVSIALPCSPAVLLGLAPASPTANPVCQAMARHVNSTVCSTRDTSRTRLCCSVPQRSDAGRSCAHAILSPSLSFTSHARALRRAAAARAVQAHSEAAHVDSLDLVLGYEAELAGAHKPQRVLLTHIVVIIDHAVHFAARACGAQHRLAL